MEKISVKNPIVEMLGDEMTRVFWEVMKDKLILPYLDVNFDTYDLSVQNRNTTRDRVTGDAALALKRVGVGIKCATITPSKDEDVKNFNLDEAWDSPNATIRNMTGGTIFREGIAIGNVEPVIPGYKHRRIVIARHAAFDEYDSKDALVEQGSNVTLRIIRPDGSVQEMIVGNFSQSAGIVTGQFNTDVSIFNFARNGFQFALDNNLSLAFGAKDTVRKYYDGRFKEIFQEVYTNEFKEKFEAKGLMYHYALIDARAMNMISAFEEFGADSKGVVWACMNRDGDVFSDVISKIYRSPGVLLSAQTSPGGCALFDAAHGTDRANWHKLIAELKERDYAADNIDARDWRNFPETIWQSFDRHNPTAAGIAMARAIKERGVRDGTPSVEMFGDALEQAFMDTLLQGKLTQDLTYEFNKDQVRLGKPERMVSVPTMEFIEEVRRNLDHHLKVEPALANYANLHRSQDAPTPSVH